MIEMKKDYRQNSWKAILLSLGLAAGAAFGVQAEEALVEEAATEAAIAEEAVAEETADTQALDVEAVEEQETEEAVPEKNIPAAFFEDGPWADLTINSMDDAAALIRKMLEEIGGNEKTQFEPWRSLTDSVGNHYYVFRQMYGSVTVSGGAVKIVTDPAGKVLGVVSSVESELPETQMQEGIFSEKAEEIVKTQMENTGHTMVDVQDGCTEKVILPVNLELDPDSEEEKEEVRYVWVVYTNNDTVSMTGASELPYLAHYVTMDGEYLYSMPTIMPSDEASSTGYNSSYVFEFMEPVDYTGTVLYSDGSEHEISISLMRDTRTGMYYLGNLERRIVVADCYEFLFNKGSVVLEASRDNTGWDNTCLLSLYNYCRAYDYYKVIGWIGGDGEGTPILILQDYCDKDKVQINNAAYAGKYYGWQVFLSSSINDFSQCLDVLTHEFTHCVTSSVMTYNAYSNDYGAINEAISDIQGNICEMMIGATEDTGFILGENSKNTVRNMGDPHEYRQPEYTWDIYYKPNVKIPTLMNDRGGVHSNSSLLNRVAYLLCTEGGMSFEEARDFWFAVDCSMVPGTDYAQLSELMPWVMKNIGLDQYLPALEDAIAATRIGNSEMPDTFDEDRALLKLELPDTPVFTDGNWALEILSVNTEKLGGRISAITSGTVEYEGSLGYLWESLVEAGKKIILEGDDTDIFAEIVRDWLRRNLEGTLYAGSGAAGADGRTIQMVATPGYTLPLLLYMKFAPNDTEPEAVGFALFVKGRWIDITTLASDNSDEELERLSEELLEWLSAEDSSWFYEIKGGQVNEIPSDGLEQVRVMDEEFLSSLMESEEEAAEGGTAENAAEEPAAEEETTEEETAEEGTTEAGEETSLEKMFSEETAPDEASGEEVSLEEMFGAETEDAA